MKRLEFISLQVNDLQASKDFYTNKLGFELSEMKHPEAVIFKYNKGEASFAIRKPLENLENKELGNGVSIWFTVDEKIEDLKTRFEQNNIKVLGLIMETPFGKAFHIKDLDGYKLTFLSNE
ncbi:VOC family protein [Aquimarina sp. 2201CG5-10]|uniref:VOC family protein n=1 Tax=Aquimarina callyspongiae TaxID=3098150 RepID=UPI002AB512FC|nr:VOC family protein [Aquimarina sp. 2201CG5-10]MDY8137539.1 VOC family protein [Aquimarina sp. 2201CG5-10]